MNVTKKIKFCINILERIKKEESKRDVFYEHGIDLINYENEYKLCLMDCLCFVLSRIDDSIAWKEYIEWWLYESVDKIIWINDEEFNVESAEQLLNCLIYNSDDV